MRSYRTFPPLPGRLSRTGKGGKVPSVPAGPPAFGGFDRNDEEGPFVPLHTTPLRCPAQRPLRCSAEGGSLRPAHRLPGPRRTRTPHSISVHLYSILAGTDQPLWRYLSVALFLKSPSAGVTRYPCPVEPGLSSWTAFRPAHATVCLPRKGYCNRRRGESQRGKSPAPLYFPPVCGIISIV